MVLDFEWDAAKEASNREKHGVTFAEARGCFYDPLGIEVLDEDSSGTEERWIRIGVSLDGRLLVTVFNEREQRIRIISSRPTTRREARAYEEGI